MPASTDSQKTIGAQQSTLDKSSTAHSSLVNVQQQQQQQQQRHRRPRKTDVSAVALDPAVYRGNVFHRTLSLDDLVRRD